MQEYIKDLKSKVEYCLLNFEKTRDDDAYLTFVIIYTFMPQEMIQQGNKHFISTGALRLVREDHVKRIRAVFQNEKKMYLPTNLETRRKRKQIIDSSEEEWRKQLGYNPELRQDTYAS